MRWRSARIQYRSLDLLEHVLYIRIFSTSMENRSNRVCVTNNVQNSFTLLIFPKTECCTNDQFNVLFSKTVTVDISYKYSFYSPSKMESSHLKMFSMLRIASSTKVLLKSILYCPTTIWFRKFIFVDDPCKPFSRTIFITIKTTYCYCQVTSSLLTDR